MDNIVSMALEKWRPIKSDNPPAQDLLLYQEEGVTLYVEASYGPAIPYLGFDHGDGQINHGYKSTKNNSEVVSEIPEVQGFQAFRDFLLKVNSEHSHVESLGCEKLESEIDVGHPSISRRVGSYTDIAFSNLEFCRDSELNLELAASLVEACRGCNEWWSNVEIGLQRLKHFHGVAAPWSLMLKISGYGSTPEQARQMWGVTADRIAEACIAFGSGSAPQRFS
jgi:hypothetical protein